MIGISQSSIQKADYFKLVRIDVPKTHTVLMGRLLMQIREKESTTVISAICCRIRFQSCQIGRCHQYRRAWEGQCCFRDTEESSSKPLPKA